MTRHICLIAMLFGLATAGFAADKAAKPYKDDPAIIKKLNALEAGHGLMLGKFRVMPKNAAKFNHTFKKGPGQRNYGKKMPYAPERGVAMYCGANHHSPHRLNDVWEFHLGSNTWHLVCPPGRDSSKLRDMGKKAKKAREAIKKGKDVEKNQAFLDEKYEPYVKKWWGSCVVTNGYLGSKVNGGPVQPWHTWDGVTYDEKSKRLYWAVLDTDQYKDPKKKIHINRSKTWARTMGLDPEKVAATIKPSSSMYMYDPVTKRWIRQMGEGPFPLMRGMGALLHYIPDIDRTIWYCCVGNTTGGYTEGMWSYDATANKWTKLIDGNKVSGMMRKKLAPGEEIQGAYSIKHKKLVVVYKRMTFVYDVPANKWIRVSDTPGYGHDAHSVFDYDSKADRFIMLSKTDGRRGKAPWKLFSYDVGTDKWATIEIKGSQLAQDPPKKAWLAQTYAGYYDPGYNAFVLYLGRSQRTWVYRHVK